MKLIKKLLVCLSPLLLFSCDSNNDSGSPLIISEFYSDSDNFYDRYFELYNISDKSINLSKYSFNIYRGSNIDPYIKIDLQGTLGSHQTYVIADSQASSQILDNTDLIYDDLSFDGTWPVSITKNGKIQDIIGTIGFSYNYAKGLNCVRKITHLVGRKSFCNYDYVRYCPGDFSHIRNINNEFDDEELLDGPRLTQEDFDKPFAISNTQGGGGAVRVTLSRVGDGDTTYFNFPSLENCNIRGSYSVRYNCIDTPEIAHGGGSKADPWGDKAKSFNNSILNKAKSFAVQTAENYMLTETYGRLMGYVWYSEKDNANPEDFHLLNLDIIKEGYSTFRSIETSAFKDKQIYQNISYTNFMYNAEQLAISKKLKVHGETDPDFK